VLPFNFVGRLGNEESLGIGRYFSASWINRNLGIETVFGFQLNGKKQKFELGET